MLESPESPLENSLLLHVSKDKIEMLKNLKNYVHFQNKKGTFGLIQEKQNIFESSHEKRSNGFQAKEPRDSDKQRSREDFLKKQKFNDFELDLTNL